ncbi:uncharacterized protein F4812DRAFT_221904 [Daldinia caldariorum]|uniref:uncharacterized protein n=1 Tax=Daldinia caldariorum TaxID=326644 RepID=UPI002007B89E|nr:uncharacterized protein F4812DRAFT_221904 [Daldinia caldariorum]KAI1464069.1 hypothetical protein F4812DRAFT_221904 [Daldinia caldariorum]
MASQLNHLDGPTFLPGLLGETKIHRSLVRIGSDQQKLLDLPSSWAQFLSNLSKPFFNVPPEVLRDLKECYSRQLQPAQSGETVLPADVQTNTNDQDERNSQIHPDPDAESDSEESQATSWYSSPYHHKTIPPKTSDESPQQPFMTQVPSVSPPRPTESTPSERQPLPPFPPSSQDQEDPLEVEVPTGINDKILPLGKLTAHVCATPPSAQVVPCTYELSEQSSTKPKSKPKQRVYKEVPEFYRPPKPRPTSAHPILDAAKPQVNVASFPKAQSSGSIGDPSSSVIPSTVPGEVPRKNPPAWEVNRPNSPLEVPHTGRDSPEAPDSPQTQPPSPEYSPPTPQLRSSPPILPVLPIASPTVTEAPSVSQTPFLRYTIAYPNYNGSINDFVTACMYIQLRRRRIRTSLYDDFIRAWHEGYLPYVRECDDSEPPMKALNAIDWYNQIDDDPVFTSRIITRQNLESTLNFYPDEFHTARELLALSAKQSREPTGTPDGTILAKGHASPRDLVVAEEAVLSKPVQDPPPAKRAESTSNDITLAAASTSPKPTHRKIIPVNQSMQEIGPRPIKAKGLTRSFSEASRHKRKSSEELNFSPPKRPSVNSLARLDSWSNPVVKTDVPKSTVQGSPAPSSTMERKRKYADDPQKRSRSFAKFLKKRQKWEKDSIASSAPVSNTPTSAQKE